MFGIILNFLKGNLMKVGIGLLVTAMISGGGWFLKNKFETDKAYERQQIEVLAIVTNEYEHTLQLLDQNSEKFRMYRQHMVTLDRVLAEKYKEDALKAKGIMKIMERGRYVNDEDDGEVSSILTDTLDGIRVLREDTDNRKSKYSRKE